MAGLEVRGLISKSRDPNDRRSFLVSITPDGQVLLDQIKRTHSKKMEAFMIGVSEPERRIFIRLLELNLNNLKTRAYLQLEDYIE